MNDRIGQWVRVVIDWNAWMWFAAIYLALILGSLFVMQILSISVMQMKAPLAILALGGVSSLIIGRSRGATGASAWLRSTPTLIYLLFIFVMSSKSFFGVRPFVNIDYFHPVEYAFLGVFFSWFWAPSLLRGEIFSFSLKVLTSGVLFGVSDELHQWFVPGRTCSIVDLILDFIGVSIGLGIVLLARRVHGFLKERFAQRD